MRMTKGQATNSSAVTTLQRIGSLIECYKYHRQGSQWSSVLNMCPSSGFAMLKGFQLPNRETSAMTFCNWVITKNSLQTYITKTVLNSDLFQISYEQRNQMYQKGKLNTFFAGNENKCIKIIINNAMLLFIHILRIHIEIIHLQREVF